MKTDWGIACIHWNGIRIWIGAEMIETIGRMWLVAFLGNMNMNMHMNEVPLLANQSFDALGID